MAERWPNLQRPRFCMSQCDNDASDNMRHAVTGPGMSRNQMQCSKGILRITLNCMWGSIFLQVCWRDICDVKCYNPQLLDAYVMCCFPLEYSQGENCDYMVMRVMGLFYWDICERMDLWEIEVFWFRRSGVLVGLGLWLGALWGLGNVESYFWI